MRHAVFLLVLGFIAACGVTSIPSIVPSAPPESGSPASGAPESGDVPTYRGDAARTGVMPGPGPLRQPDVLWRFQAEGGIRSSPAVVGDTVFVASVDGFVRALSLRAGDVRWEARLGAKLGAASPLVADGKVVIGDAGGIVHALDTATGAEAWRISTDGPIAGAAAAVDDLLFVGTESGTAYALEQATGQVRWQATLPAGVTRSMTASGDLVYCALGRGFFDALRIGDGSLAWEARFVDDGGGGTPTVAEGLVFAATGLDGSDPAARAIVALDAGTGTERWRRASATGAFIYTPAVVGNRAYIVAEDNTVVAVDAQTGDLHWTATTGAPNDAPVSIWDGTAFVATAGGSLQALDIETGAHVWEVGIVGVPYAPVVTGGLVLVGTNVGVLYAFGDPTS